MTTTFEDEARAALAAKADAERQLAAAVNCPPWRHAAFGGLMATLVAAPTVPLPARFVLLAAMFVAMFLIVRSDRKRMGMFVNGYRRGKTLFVSFAMLAIDLGLYSFNVHRGLNGGSIGLMLAVAALAFAVSVVGSIIWQRVFVRELGA